MSRPPSGLCTRSPVSPPHRSPIVLAIGTVVPVVQARAQHVAAVPRDEPRGVVAGALRLAGATRCARRELVEVVVVGLRAQPCFRGGERTWPVLTRHRVAR